MKIDRVKAKCKGAQPPADVHNLIKELQASAALGHETLAQKLSCIEVWKYSKSDFYYWHDIVDLFDDILDQATAEAEPPTVSSDSASQSTATKLSRWYMQVDIPQNTGLRGVVCEILHFFSLLIENTFSRSSFSSVDRLYQLLFSDNLHVVYNVLVLLYTFARRSNLFGRLQEKQKRDIFTILHMLASPWSSCSFTLATCCSHRTQSLPPDAAAVKFQCAAKPSSSSPAADSLPADGGRIVMIDANVAEQAEMPSAHIMVNLLVQTRQQSANNNTISNAVLPELDENDLQKLFLRIRLAKHFTSPTWRVMNVQVRLQALTVLLHNNALSQPKKFLFNGFLDELVDILKLDDDDDLADIKTCVLRTLTAIIHYNNNAEPDRLRGTSSLNSVLQATGLGSQYSTIPSTLRGGGNEPAHALGSTIEQLAQHYPALRQDAVRAVVNMLNRLVEMGNSPTICAGPSAKIPPASMVPQLAGEIIDSNLPVIHTHLPPGSPFVAGPAGASFAAATMDGTDAQRMTQINAALRSVGGALQVLQQIQQQLQTQANAASSSSTQQQQPSQPIGSGSSGNAHRPLMMDDPGLGLRYNEFVQSMDGNNGVDLIDFDQDDEESSPPPTFSPPSVFGDLNILGAVTAIQFIPQIISRITYFLPVYDRINCKNVAELFDDIANSCIFDTLCLAPFSCYLLDLKSLVRQLKHMVKRRCKNFTKAARMRLARSTGKKYKSFLLDIVESNTLTNLKAFYVNADVDEASVRLRDVVSMVCSSNMNTIERFGCLNFRVLDNHLEASASLYVAVHDSSPPGREGFTYAEVIEWFKSMPHLSVLYLSSMFHLSTTSNWALEDKADPGHREKLAQTWAPLAADKAPRLANLRQIHFFEQSFVVEALMADFVRPFSQVELVTLSELRMYDNIEDFVAVTPKMRTLFPNAAISPRAVFFCLSSVLSLWSIDDEEPGKTAGECEAILRNMVHNIQKAATSGLPISLSFCSSHLHALKSLNLLPFFDSVLETLSSTLHGSFEFTVDPVEKLSWTELRSVVQFWTMRGAAKPRPRGSRLRIKLYRGGDSRCERLSESDYADIDNAEEAVPNIFEPPVVAVAEPVDDVVHNDGGVDVPADIVAERSSSIQECLKTLFRTLDVAERSKEMHDQIFADAYYADIVRKRFSWLLTWHSEVWVAAIAAHEEGESVSGGLFGMDDAADYDVAENYA